MAWKNFTGKMYYARRQVPFGAETGLFKIPVTHMRVYRNRNGNECNQFHGISVANLRGYCYISLLDPYFLKMSSAFDKNRIESLSKVRERQINITRKDSLYLPKEFREDLGLCDQIAIISMAGDVSHLELWKPEELERYDRENPVDWREIARISLENLAEDLQK